jgi:hypothetical protein
VRFTRTRSAFNHHDSLWRERVERQTRCCCLLKFCRLTPGAALLSLGFELIHSSSFSMEWMSFSVIRPCSSWCVTWESFRSVSASFFEGGDRTDVHLFHVEVIQETTVDFSRFQRSDRGGIAAHNHHLGISIHLFNNNNTEDGVVFAKQR